jgi:hypothetical protein
VSGRSSSEELLPSTVTSGHSLQTYRKQNYRREKCEIGETQLVGGINKIEIFSKSWKWKQKYKK